MILFSSLTQSCASSNNDQYYWGEYEELLYKSFNHEHDSNPTNQIQKLLKDIDKAQAKGKKVPPGVYAYLGYMQHLEGNDPAAKASLEKEKALYPPSKKFVDRLITSMSGQKESP